MKKFLLRALRISRVDLVDNGANQDESGEGSHVMLYKRASEPTEEDMPKKDSDGFDVTDLPEGAQEHVAALEKAAEDAAEAQTKAQSEVEALKTQVADLTAKVEELTPAADESEDVAKRADLDPAIREYIEKRDSENEAQRARIEKLEADASLARFEKMATAQTPTIAPKGGAILKAASDGMSDEDFEGLMEILRSAEEVAKQADALTKEIGAGGDAEMGDAETELAKKAAEIQKRDNVTSAIAMDTAMTEHPTLAAQAVRDAGN